MKFEQAWIEKSHQTPPPTLVVVHDSIYGSTDQDQFHDRYIVTKGSGLSIGTSLNGLGNKEFFVSVLTEDDASYVEFKYIDPKLNLQEHFSKTVYFEIDI